ncbi:MAG: hypothetical protein GY855_11865 [candidate division Zixibacteria bacterium]|nr:hypothetical protein [candidate division Zixibacteria bacterium]
MPCLEIVMPREDIEIKRSLAGKLTDAFSNSTGFPGEIFGIHFIEYDIGDTASGGDLWDNSAEIPYLHFKLFCPRINRKTKQAVVSSFTETFIKCFGKPEWKPVIHICEHSYDNVGVNGQLLSDAYEECADRQFYYDLVDEK